MSKGKTRKTRPVPFVEITPETEAVLMRLDVLIGIARRKKMAALARAAECRFETGPNSGYVIRTPESEAAQAAFRAAFEELHQAYLRIWVTPDLPEDVLIRVLAYRLHVEDERRWTAWVRSLDGPRIRPRWLQDYVIDHLRGLDRPIDRRVRAAMMLADKDVRAALREREA